MYRNLRVLRALVVFSKIRISLTELKFYKNEILSLLLTVD